MAGASAKVECRRERFRCRPGAAPGLRRPPLWARRSRFDKAMHTNDKGTIAASNAARLRSAQLNSDPKAIGLSPTDLAEVLDAAFKQAPKDGNGPNETDAGRLIQVAEAVALPLRL